MQENQFTQRRNLILRCYENREILRNIHISSLNPIKEKRTTASGHDYEALIGYDAVVFFANTKLQIIIPHSEIETIEFINHFEDKSAKEDILARYPKLVGSTMDLIITSIEKNETDEMIVLASQKKASAKKRSEIESVANSQDGTLDEVKVIMRKGNFAILEKNGYYNPVNLYYAGEQGSNGQGISVGDSIDMVITGYNKEQKLFRGYFEKEKLTVEERLRKYNVSIDSVVSARVVKVYSKNAALVSIHPLQLIAKASIQGSGDVQPDQFLPMLITGIKEDGGNTRIYGSIIA